MWKDELKSVKASLGLSGRTVPYCVDIILEATGRELFQMPVPYRTSVSKPATPYGPGKEWRFLRNEHTGRHQFLGFVNAKSSSSLRYFDAESGLQMGDTRYGRKSPYQVAFARELRAAAQVRSPKAASNSQIAQDHLLKLRAQVGLTEVKAKVASVATQASILAGVDSIVDRALGVSNTGGTAPHYRHLTAYRAVAKAPAIEGAALEVAQKPRCAWP
jgi:hypothetical protein